MNHPSSLSETQEQRLGVTPSSPGLASSEPQASYVKLAMRNMVRKGGKSLQHFFLTTVGLLTVLVGLAYLTH
ncbi:MULTISPECIES: DUF3285 domain-containing protein [unclassified Coleofasciculus]|uniref:DUF3285 domain-containing protein n=1 Tax=unclassified Coleofasciculus TaxID=2692782 RepID=UPI0018818F93|nr:MULTISPECIES: DUF3285 domain-containing protein [unclassified Coleofasciculus]MBE9128667.1 DUF3285 domain-containing protein [Coleofasciculus sp. LEGE 07081]MBE9149738.1 DUF3285 domain-containing protein [Coleofasciculus sp. LEGE 07092]